MQNLGRFQRKNHGNGGGLQLDGIGDWIDALRDYATAHHTEDPISQHRLRLPIKPPWLPSLAWVLTIES